MKTLAKNDVRNLNGGGWYRCKACTYTVSEKDFWFMAPVHVFSRHFFRWSDWKKAFY